MRQYALSARILCLSTAVAVGALLAGCAPTASTAVFALPSAPTLSGSTEEYSTGDPVLVAVEFPAAITPEAQKTWVRRLVLGFGDTEDYSSEVMQSLYVNEALNDSIYHSLEVYKALRQQLPASSIILVPQKIVFEDGKLETQPLLAGGPPPALVRLSLSAMDNPNREKVMETPYLTFGDTFTPALSVAYDDWLGGPTAGLLIETTFRGICQNQVNDVPIFECLNGVDGLAAATEIEQKHIRKFRIPAQKTRLDIALAKKAPSELDGQTAGLFQADAATVSGSFTRAFTPLLQGVVGFSGAAFEEYEARADSAHLSRYIAQLAGDDANVDLSVGGNLALARKLYSAEVSALAQASDAMLANIYEGEFGEAFRQVLATEAELLETRRDVAKKQNTSAILGLIGGALAGASGDAGLMSTVQHLAMTNSQIAAAQDQKVIDLVNSFSTTFITVYQDQSLERDLVIEGVETTLTGSLADLRSKLREIWLQNRS